MKIRFRRFEAGDREAISRLNERLRAGGVEHVVGSEATAGTDPSHATQPIVERMFVAADEGEIRGAVWLKEQSFACREGLVRAGWVIYPVAESLIDKRFAGVPGALLFGLIRRQPRLMALGMGGEGGPLARVLSGAGWESALVPFWFRMLRPARVLRQLDYVRRTRLRRAVADALAASGLAWLSHAVATGIRSGGRAGGAALAEASVVERFAGWSDDVWESCRERYGFVAVRDACALDALYPPELRPLDRIRVERSGRDIGWVCVQAIDAGGTRLRDHFGELRVGVVTDAFGDPADAGAVLQAGFRRLVDAGVDLVVTNQTHPAWCGAARALGFWQGPSNLAFSWSPAAGKLFAGSRDCHLTRSDGDGPEPG